MAASTSAAPPLAAFASLLTARRFASAKSMLSSLLTPGLLAVPFADLAAANLPRAAPPHAVAAFHDMLFRAYADAGAAERAAEALDLTVSRLGSLDPRSLTSSLLSLRRAGQLAAAADLLRRALISCPDSVSPLSASVVVDGFCKSGRIADARQPLDEMPRHGVKPNALCYNSLLDSYKRQKDNDRVLEVIKVMENEGVEAIVATYTILVDGFSAARDIDKVEAVINEMKRNNVAGDVYFYTAVISAYCRAGNVRRASEVFDECVGNGIGIEPNERTYVVLIDGFCKIGQMEAAEMLLADMQGRGVGHNKIIFNTMIHGYCRKGMVDSALKIKEAMEKTGIELDIYTYNTLACGLCRVNRMDDAKTLLHIMIEKGVAPNYVSYTTLISIHCKEGDMVEARRLFREMAGKGVMPSVVTYNVMMDGYIKKGSIREAERFRKEMEKKGLVPDVYTYASLVHGHCVNGKVNVALKLFEEMKQRGTKPNAVAYTALVSGLAKEGRSEEAFQLYDDLLKAGLTPDESLYSALVGSLHTDKRKDILPPTKWDSSGPFKPLHLMNPTPLSFIRSTLCRYFRRDPYSSKPLEGLKVIDVGCGGGILSEPLARMGAAVTAIDAVDKNIKIASIHVASDPATASIEYCCTTAEELVKEKRLFDAVISLEVIEHVANPLEFCKSLSALTVPNGATVVSTINRSMRVYATAIVGAEYILRWVSV